MKRLTRLRLLWPLLKLVGEYVDRDDDDWVSLPHHVPLESFGAGCIQEFQWYFEGDSQVAVRTIDDLCHWLLECEYVSDADLYGADDFWQHPNTFERLRKGDCEDFALWAWRKLIRLGIPAHFVAGQLKKNVESTGGHAWVVFEESGREFLLEAVGRSRDVMIQPLEQASTRYVPHVSVDEEFKRHVYGGFVLYWIEARSRRRAARKREA